MTKDERERLVKRFKAKADSIHREGIYKSDVTYGRAVALEEVLMIVRKWPIEEPASPGDWSQPEAERRGLAEPWEPPQAPG